MPAPFAVCTSCRKAIPAGAVYYRCSVTACNAGRQKLSFCSRVCWEAHLRPARHRGASCIEERAPAEPAQG